MHIQSGRKYGTFIAGLFIQFISVGLGYGYSVMFAELLDVYNTTRFSASFVQGIYFFMNFSGGLLWSGVIHKFGTGPTTIFGIILSAAGLLVCSFVSHIAEVIVLAGVVCGLGMSVCYLSTFICVSEAFKDDPRFFLTSLTIGASFGHIALPMLFEIVIAKYFLSGAFIILAGVILQCLPFGLVMYLHSEKDKDPKHEEVSRPVVCDALVLKDIVLCTVLVNTMLMFMTGNIEALFIVDQLIGQNYPRSKGSVLLAFTGMAAVIGRCLASFTVFKCTRWPIINHLVYVSLIVAVGHILVLELLKVYTFLVLVSFLRGTGFGMFNALTPVVVYEAAESEKYPAAMAFANVAIGCGDFLSCTLGGIVRDAMGNYRMVYYIATGIAVYVAISSLLIAYRIYKKEQRKSNELTKEISSQISYETLK